MIDEWKNMPCASRPRIPVFPRGLAFFRLWKTVRWFLLLVFPMVASAASMYLRRRSLGATVGLLVIDTCFASVLFVDLCSGTSSSNWGNYCRRREPVRYWLVTGWLGLFYLACLIAGYMG